MLARLNHRKSVGTLRRSHWMLLALPLAVGGRVSALGATWPWVDVSPFPSRPAGISNVWPYLPDDVNAIWGLGPTEVFLGGTDTSIWRYHDRIWTLTETISPPSSYLKEVIALGGTNANNLFAATTLSDIVHYDGTLWTQVPHVKAYLYDIWASGPKDVFAVGSGGTILHYDGSSWSTMNSGTNLNLASAWGSGPDNVYAVGSGMGGEVIVLHYDGAAWTPLAFSWLNARKLTSVWGSSADDVYIVGHDNVILHFDGDMWTSVAYSSIKWQNPYTNSAAHLNDIYGSGPDCVFAVGQEEFRYDDGRHELLALVLHKDAGSTWYQEHQSYLVYYPADYDYVGPEELNAVWCSAPDCAYVVMHGGVAMRRSVTPVGTWEDVDMRPDMYDVWGSGPDNIYVVGSDRHGCGPGGTILHWNGTKWSMLPTASGLYNELYDVWGSGPTDVFATVGGTSYQGREVIHYDGSGWSKTNLLGSGLMTTALWGSGPQDVYAVGWVQEAGGRVMRYDGVSWTKIVDTTEKLYDVWGSGPDNIFFVGHKGTLIQYNGQTGNSVMIALMTQAALRVVWGSGPNDVFVLSGHPDEVDLHYDGQAWSQLPWPSQITRFHITSNGLWGSGPNDVYLAGSVPKSAAPGAPGGEEKYKSVGRVMRYDGSGWKEVASAMTDGVAFKGIWGSGSDNIYVVGDDGTILRCSPIMVEDIVGQGTLSIDTTPVKGEVFVDGTSWGLAPQSREVAAHQYTVSFGTVAGFSTPPDQVVTVVEAQTTTVTGQYQSAIPGGPCGSGILPVFPPVLVWLGLVKLRHHSHRRSRCDCEPRSHPQ